MFYKISEADLLLLTKAAHMIDYIDETYDSKDLIYNAYENIPSDEEIIEEINSCYEICKW